MTRVRIPTRTVRSVFLDCHYATYRKALTPTYKANFVPGVGDVMSGVVFVGEAPGQEEDWSEKPFAPLGASGSVLNAMFEHAGIERSAVFITNLIKFRPPGNKFPDRDLPAALQLLRMELDILRPRVLILMGAQACKLYWATPPMNQMAGSTFIKGDRVVVPLLHPAVAARQRSRLPEMKKHMEVAAAAIRGE